MTSRAISGSISGQRPLPRRASLEEIFKNGTLAIGFIGLSEAVKLLTGDEYYASERELCDCHRYC